MGVEQCSGNCLVKILVILNPIGYMLTSFGFAFIHLVYSIDSSKTIGNFFWSLELQPVVSRIQPVHLQLTAGSSRT